MRRPVTIVIVATVLLTIGIANAGEGQSPKQTKDVRISQEALQQLDYFVGTWEVEGTSEGETGKAQWTFAWEKGKPCLRCNQVWSDSRGTDYGAGIFGYDTAKKQMVYLQFYASGANAIFRCDVKSPTLLKGVLQGVSDACVAAEGKFQIEKKSPTHFVSRTTGQIDENGQQVPDTELHFRKIP